MCQQKPGCLFVMDKENDTGWGERQGVGNGGALLIDVKTHVSIVLWVQESLKRQSPGVAIQNAPL